ncbi:MAG: DUF2303 family protein [Planctomycetota bacterium]
MDEFEEAKASGVAAALDFAVERCGAEVLDDPELHAGTLAFLPKGLRVERIGAMLEELMPNPRRRRGRVELLDEASFIEWVNRSQVAGVSAIYADEDTIVAVINDDEPDDPKKHDTAGWRDFRGTYDLPRSTQWKDWESVSGQSLTQAEFATLLEDRILDVLDPSAVGDATLRIADALGVSVASPSALMELSRGLSVRVNSKVAQAVNLSSGEAQLTYTEEHVGEKGAPLKVPGAFAIGIPVFKGGVAYSLPVRLRYRISNEGRVTWTVQLLRAQESFEDALAELLERIRHETGLNVFRGRAGAPR